MLFEGLSFLLLVLAAIVAFLMYIRLPPGVPNEKFTGLNVGHRGCRRFDNIPENSIPSFQFAIDNGADAIELDCRLSADGQIVVLHDDTLKRLLVDPKGGVDASGYLSDSTYDRIKTLSYKDHSNPNEHCPLLVEVLELARKNNVKVFVELKSMYIKDAYPLSLAVTKLFNEGKYHDVACIIAFSPLVVYWVRKLDPLIETCILYSDDFYAWAYISGLEKINTLVHYFYPVLDIALYYFCIYVVPWLTGCTMIGPNATLLSKAEVISYQKRGLSIYVWVCNTGVDYDYFAALKCSVGTDVVFPKLTRNLPMTTTASTTTIVEPELPTVVSSNKPISLTA